MNARIDEDFRAFVTGDGFSCLAGKGVVRSGDYAIRSYGALGSPRSARRLARELAAFVASAPEDDGRLSAFVAVFPNRPPADEASFERRLWEQLQLLHDSDSAAAEWDPSVSDDPDDPRFAFSFAGRAFFVVGLHPASSRLSRRFQWPTLVFNARRQFDRLRSQGRFERLRGMIREREIALQGSLNPNLADFGERSDARQYSGRAVEADWKCPFHRKEP
jgi:FPC/CPF motif-containing protein YcgG